MSLLPEDFQTAIDAYLEGRDASPSFLACGALLSFEGMVDNGGLMGTLENLHASGDDQVLADAVAALRAHGLDDLADLTQRADTEYQRMRPHPDAELSEADELLWEQLDDQWYAMAEGRITQAVSGA
ncbi:hypothetical protein SAMN05445756_1688 [Kytococcus aerolatus]|uniref:DNA mimic protein DMP19 C-terminal domain-containing protein n=1 Tax=Kytococcus aerolatus TaxID=592308 RepID=A0A212U186_9MICO|nr:hypothetical protein [Kytococcus aerolatus]SNC71998.1 hypothetical protein SAMN05445756_1688 [Kytococcus aerolatus]